MLLFLRTHILTTPRHLLPDCIFPPQPDCVIQIGGGKTFRPFSDANSLLQSDILEQFLRVHLLKVAMFSACCMLFSFHKSLKYTNYCLFC